jgi:hypothetical protein
MLFSVLAVVAAGLAIETVCWFTRPEAARLRAARRIDRAQEWN